MRKEGLSRGRRSLAGLRVDGNAHAGSRRPPICSGSAPTPSAGLPPTTSSGWTSSALRRQIEEDLRLGHQPFLVVGTAGSVSTGVVDPLPEIAAICREHELWFHVDGAYGALAAQAPGSPASLRALSEADSVAVDPHKWLYAPLEAGCVLVRDAATLRDAFSYHPAYYHFDDQVVNYFDYGPQNSRGFRALKVWLALRQVGARRLSEDDRGRHAAREASPSAAWRSIPSSRRRRQSLSITTFRYVPPDLQAAARIRDGRRAISTS